MKRLIAVGAALLVLAAAGTAGAAGPTQASRIAKLEKQVALLTAQVKKLQAMERFDRQEIEANYAGDACATATMADLFQSTWATIDQGAASPKFTTEPRVSDKDSCTGIVTRPGIKTPPSIAVFPKLITWILGA